MSFFITNVLLGRTTDGDFMAYFYSQASPCSPGTDYTTGGAVISCGIVSMCSRCHWVCMKLLPAYKRLLLFPLPPFTVLLAFRRHILGSRWRYLILRVRLTSATGYIKNGGWRFGYGWNLGLPLYLGNNILWISYLSFYLAIGDKFSGLIVSRTE